MMIRVPRRATSKPLFLILILLCVTAFPLNAAHEVVVPTGSTTTTWSPAGSAAADSSGNESSDQHEGDPIDIDQIIEILVTFASAVQRWGL
ncbi:MAG: hypothetical protein R3E12_08195 [Candidatus Eisenbacteria bacterium]|uniref:Secreted protein n=1 Tax=Eiseniibacteriota bacterium TaxID=2212470 RepID=A0A956LY33_UNCEI|nr:hypothetical protein [Candidatus Eisenbacteria bacterium]